jgi:hypothetical protein
MDCEKYTLAPSLVVDKARKLANVGLYLQALEMLQRNCVEARVYPTWVEMSIPRPTEKRQRGYFKKGHSVRGGRGVKKSANVITQTQP